MTDTPSKTAWKRADELAEGKGFRHTLALYIDEVDRVARARRGENGAIEALTARLVEGSKGLLQRGTDRDGSKVPWLLRPRPQAVV